VNQAIEQEEKSTLKYSVLLMGLVVAGLFQNCGRSFERLEEKSVAKYREPATSQKVEASYEAPAMKIKKVKTK
jgi:hypothetical protein